MPVIETSIHKASGFSTYFFHTLIKQRPIMNEPHIEIKAWKNKKIDSTKAKEICQKGTVIGVMTTGKITQPAKIIFDKADIAWVENFP